MRNFVRRQEGRNSHSQNYGDAGRRRWVGKRAICSPNEVLGWLLIFMVRVAQLVRALDCGSRGRGFDSRLSPVA